MAVLRVRDTVWTGRVQEMVLPDGSAKGLRTILAERGINHKRMKAGDMRTVLSNHDRMRRLLWNNMLRAEDTRHFIYRNFIVK